MYQNPFVIKPGEKFTRQQLFDRYISWRVYCQHNHLLLPNSEYTKENDVFCQQLRDLGMIPQGSVGVSNYLLKKMIVSFGLAYILTEIAFIMGLSAPDCAVFLVMSSDGG